MTSHKVKIGKKIIGFVFQDKRGQWQFAFGRPSQSNFIAFHCQNLRDGIDLINKGYCESEMILNQAIINKQPKMELSTLRRKDILLCD